MDFYSDFTELVESNFRLSDYTLLFIDYYLVCTNYLGVLSKLCLGWTSSCGSWTIGSNFCNCLREYSLQFLQLFRVVASAKLIVD